MVRKMVEELPWPILIIFALGLGLAPFSPPHLFEKIQMLSRGELVKPVDWFDLVMHGTPWLLIAVKLFVAVRKGPTDHLPK